MVSLLKEQENFLRYAILTVDHSNNALQNFIELHLKNKNQTFAEFLSHHQHEIYHLFYESKCCQCGQYQPKPRRILSASQMGLLFEKQIRLSVHKPTRNSDFCCAYVKPGVTIAVLDVALARCLLMNCCIDLFWFSCLDFQNTNFEQFLNSNKHTIYHLWNTKDKCCLCQQNFIFPSNDPLIMENEWNDMFSRTLTPCEIDLNTSVNGSISVCGVAAKPGITIQQIHLDLQNIILQYCCSTRKSVATLAELRNLNFGHMKKTLMSCADFTKSTKEAENAILDITIVCGKDREYKQRLHDLHEKPLDTRMFCQYEKILLQTITTYESIQQDIKAENDMLKDRMMSLENSNFEIKETIDDMFGFVKGMAMSTLDKEQENFLRYAILIVDHSKEALQDLVDLNINNEDISFEEFLNKNQHEIYHLCYDFRCCQCHTSSPRRNRKILPAQLELLFDKYNKLPSHKGTRHNDYCCSYAKHGITPQVLDISLARCLLVNFRLDVFWFACLTLQGHTLEQFLNINKHIVYHLSQPKTNCCQCQPGFIFPYDIPKITENEWKNMYSSQLLPCTNHRKRTSTGTSSICSVSATPGIVPQDINPEIQRLILQNCSHVSKAIDFLLLQRNLRFAHASEAKLSNSDFTNFLKDIEHHLLGIARVCGKEKKMQQSLRDLHLKPFKLV